MNSKPKTTLITGGAASIFMVEYLKRVHNPLEEKIYLFAYEEVPSHLKPQYENMGIQIVNLNKSKSKFSKISKFFTMFKFALKHRKYNTIDYCEVHIPPHSVQAYILGFVLKILRAKNFLIFWGSDILKLDSKYDKRMEYLLKQSHAVSLPTDNMREAFCNHFGNRYDDIMYNCKLGSLGFDAITETLKTSSREDCKRQLGIDPSQTVIAVGYNGKRRHQHIKAIDALGKLSAEIKEKITVLIHVGNECEADYMDEIKSSLKANNLKSCIIARPLSLEEIAPMRIATDIFLHAQISDAFASSIRECIYAGGLLINPTWIKYYEYDKLGIKFIKYDSFDEIPGIVTKIFTEGIQIDLKKNSELIYQNFSWEFLKKNWMEMLNE